MSESDQTKKIKVSDSDVTLNISASAIEDKEPQPRTVAEERGNSAADVGVGGEASASVDPVAKTPPSSPSHSSSVAKSSTPSNSGTNTDDDSPRLRAWRKEAQEVANSDGTFSLYVSELPIYWNDWKLNDATVLRRIFSRYGTVLSVYPRVFGPPETRWAIVTMADFMEARQAKRFARDDVLDFGMTELPNIEWHAIQIRQQQ